jgi:hypothetical protein
MAMKKPLIELLGGDKFIIAGVHFLPLPGSRVMTEQPE